MIFARVDAVAVDARLGERIERVRLDPGDRVQVGRVEMVALRDAD